MTTNPIPPDWDVPQAFRDRMGATAGKQRAMEASGHLLIVLHELPDPSEPATRRSHLYWRAPEGTWRSTAARGAPGLAPLRAHVDTFSAKADELEDRVERAQTADDYFAALREVAPLLRSSRNMHRALQQAREARPDDRTLIALRDASNDVERAAELLHAHAKEGLDFTVARKSEEQARSAAYIGEAGHRLNLLAAFFFPITALGALLGMNLQHGFETWNAPYTFWLVALACFGGGFAVRATLPTPPATLAPPVAAHHPAAKSVVRR